MKFALAALLVSMSVPAFAGPSLKCSINGEALVGVLQEDGKASVASSKGSLDVVVQAVRSGGYKGSSVQDTVTVTIKDEFGTLETVSALSSIALENRSFAIECAVSNY